MGNLQKQTIVIKQSGGYVLEKEREKSVFYIRNTCTTGGYYSSKTTTMMELSDLREDVALSKAERKFDAIVTLPGFWAKLLDTPDRFVAIPVVQSAPTVPIRIETAYGKGITSLYFENNSFIDIENVSPIDIIHEISRAMSVDINKELCEFYHDHDEKVSHLSVVHPDDNNHDTPHDHEDA